MKSLPSPNGENGRDVATGRFVKGWRGGPGNPLARRTADIRRTLMDTVTDDDLRQLVRTLVDKGKGGDVIAAREVLDRLVGKPKASLAIEQENVVFGEVRFRGGREVIDPDEQVG
jgi:hypothetical protein